MSKKAEINMVEAAMKQAGISPTKIREVIESLNAEAGSEEKERVPALKKQFVIILSDPLGKIAETDFVGWVAQIPEEDAPATVRESVETAAHLFNSTKRGRLMPVQTVGEAIESVPSWAFKENHVWIKTREPVQVIVTMNEIDGTPGLLPNQAGPSGLEKFVHKMKKTLSKVENGSVTIRHYGKPGVVITKDGITKEPSE